MYMHVKGNEGGVRKQIPDLDLRGTGECAAFNLRRVSRAVSQGYDAALSTVGMRSTQFTVLIAVAKNQPVAVSRLAEVTMMSQTAMTRALAPMARDGLVEIPARGKKREKRVSLTPAGERALSRAVPVWRAAQDTFINTFGARQWREMRLELQRAAHVNLSERS